MHLPQAVLTVAIEETAICCGTFSSGHPCPALPLFIYLLCTLMANSYICHCHRLIQCLTGQVNTERMKDSLSASPGTLVLTGQITS